MDCFVVPPRNDIRVRFVLIHPVSVSGLKIGDSSVRASMALGVMVVGVARDALELIKAVGFGVQRFGVLFGDDDLVFLECFLKQVVRVEICDKLRAIGIRFPGVKQLNNSFYHVWVQAGFKFIDDCNAAIFEHRKYVAQ